MKNFTYSQVRPKKISAAMGRNRIAQAIRKEGDGRMTPETQGKTEKDNVNQDKRQTKPTELVSPKADVLDQTRLRAPSTVLRYSNEGKIISLLLNLKSLGKADLTVKFVSDRLKYPAKYVNLDDANAVNLFIARKQCLESHKDGLVKAYNHYAQFYGFEYVKPKFRCEKKPF